MTILLKRAYETADKNDGFRILVDRIWPRGVSKDFAHIDFWAKDVTPTTSLRKWFSHDPLKWVEFKKNYVAELDAVPDVVDGFLHLEGYLCIWCKRHRAYSRTYIARVHGR